MLEELINVKLAIAKKKPKHEVKQKCMDYLETYKLKQSLKGEEKQNDN